MKSIIFSSLLVAPVAFSEGLSLKAQAVAVRSQHLELSLPSITVTGGPLATVGSLTVQGARRIEIAPTGKHAWSFGAMELDHDRVNYPRGPTAPGQAFNLGVRLSDKILLRMRSPYIGFQSTTPNVNTLNISSPNVRIWQRQGSLWTMRERDLRAISDRLSDIRPSLQLESMALAPLKVIAPMWIRKPAPHAGYATWSGHVGTEAIPWCNNGDCCQWVADNPCPSNTVVVAGGCEFTGDPYIVNEKPIAPIVVNIFKFETNSWRCEAWQQDVCTFKPILLAHVTCMESAAYWELAHVDNR